MCSHCWDEGGPHHKDFIRGAVEPDDFEKEVNYKPKAKKSKSVSKRNYPGCPGNEGKAHVYVWTTEYEVKDFFYDYYGFYKNQSRICAGCGKKNGSKPSDPYMRRKNREWDKRYGGEYNMERGKPLSRYRRGPSFSWWSWESYDEEFTTKRREYIKRYGWTHYIYGF